VISDATIARDLLHQGHHRHTTEAMLAAAQVHATLAVEQAVRDLIERVNP
jgi:hypothetical protein